LVERIAARWEPESDATDPPTPLRVHATATDLSHRDAYRLTVRSDGVDIEGASPAGCFHGLQTLAQLAASARDGRVACCEILDRPDFTTRGLLFDVTRGRVPRLETLKLLADRLSALKANQLQLNIEHAFVFSFDPEICHPDEGLTPDEIREFDAYCHDRFIELVPAPATFGHMGRILSMPKYRHLAEVEATSTWDRMTWLQRMRGLTLDCANPEAHELIERMWSDVLDAFRSPVVNICGDEPHDLGQGKNRARFAGRIGEAYLEQIRRTYEICARRGRRVQFWSDVVRNHSDLFDMVPRDATVLHWGYDDPADYEGTQRLVEAGLDTIVCPGTSGWKRILNGMNLAERNIARFAEAGKRYGATGLVTTDWGDHGHFNMLGCSWHGIALGAAKAWRANHPTGSHFDRLFAAPVLGVEDAGVVALLREAARSGDACETWRQLWMPADGLTNDPSIPEIEAVAEFDASASAAAAAARNVPRSAPTHSIDFEELGVACTLLQLWTRKMKFLKSGMQTESQNTLLETPLVDYCQLWLQRSKPGGLAEVQSVLDKVHEHFSTSRSL